MKHNQEYLEKTQKTKFQFKKETIEVTVTDPKGLETVEQQEVFSFLGTSNVKLPECEVEIDEKEITKAKLKEIQAGSYMDKKYNVLK